MYLEIRSETEIPKLDSKWQAMLKMDRTVRGAISEYEESQGEPLPYDFPKWKSKMVEKAKNILLYIVSYADTALSPSGSLGLSAKSLAKEFIPEDEEHLERVSFLEIYETLKERYTGDAGIRATLETAAGNLVKALFGDRNPDVQSTPKWAVIEIDCYTDYIDERHHKGSSRVFWDREAWHRVYLIASALEAAFDHLPKEGQPDFEELIRRLYAVYRKSERRVYPAPRDAMADSPGIKAIAFKNKIQLKFSHARARELQTFLGKYAKELPKAA